MYGSRPERRRDPTSGRVSGCAMLRHCRQGVGWDGVMSCGRWGEGGLAGWVLCMLCFLSLPFFPFPSLSPLFFYPPLFFRHCPSRVPPPPHHITQQNPTKNPKQQNLTPPPPKKNRKNPTNSVSSANRPIPSNVSRPSSSPTPRGKGYTSWWRTRIVIYIFCNSIRTVSLLFFFGGHGS